MLYSDLFLSTRRAEQLLMENDMKAISRFLDRFADLPPMANTENLYHPSTPEGVIRRENAELYLRLMAASRPRVLIVGEAPGYQGSRRTGVPFASEFILEGGLPDVPFFAGNRGFRRVFSDARTYREPTSTVMWRTISRCESLPVLWAAFPLHPHELANIESNRTPTAVEVRALAPLLNAFLGLFAVEQVLALGNTAHTALKHLGMEVPKLRHPAHGGATIFARQLHAILPPRD